MVMVCVNVQKFQFALNYAYYDCCMSKFRQRSTGSLVIDFGENICQGRRFQFD